MGAAPRCALLSLGLPASLPIADLDALLAGLTELAARYRVTLVGGNVTRSPGPAVRRRHADRPRQASQGVDPRRRPPGRCPLRHRHARRGVRRPRLARRARSAWPRRPTCPRLLQPAVLRYLRPEPRLRFGIMAGRTRAASACMDLSDGLADAVRQVSDASGTGARIDLESLPVDAAATVCLRRRGRPRRAGGDLRRRRLRAAVRRPAALGTPFRRGRTSHGSRRHPHRRADPRAWSDAARGGLPIAPGRQGFEHFRQAVRP